MDVLINFFTLRPLFTFAGLKIVWYIYLLHTVVQLYISVAEISQVLAQKGISFLTWSPNFIPAILGLIAQIILVRLMIEVAASILLSPRQRQD